jgi:hypothetical protein
MNVVMIGVVVFVSGILGALAKSLLAEEICSRLDRLPGWLLRRAARQLGPEQQMIYDEVWLPDLAYILRDAEGRPITRLVTGVRFAIGLLVSTRREARHSQPAVPEETVLELRDPAQPVIAAIEASPPGPSGPEIISGDLTQPALFKAYNGGPVPTMSTGSGHRPADSGGAVPTTTVRRWTIPSILAAEAAMQVIVQTRREVRGEGVVGQMLSGPAYYD